MPQIVLHWHASIPAALPAVAMLWILSVTIMAATMMRALRKLSLAPMRAAHIPASTLTSAVKRLKVHQQAVLRTLARRMAARPPPLSSTPITAPSTAVSIPRAASRCVIWLRVRSWHFICTYASIRKIWILIFSPPLSLSLSFSLFLSSSQLHFCFFSLFRKRRNSVLNTPASLHLVAEKGKWMVRTFARPTPAVSSLVRPPRPCLHPGNVRKTGVSMKVRILEAAARSVCSTVAQRQARRFAKTPRPWWTSWSAKTCTSALTLRWYI